MVRKCGCTRAWLYKAKVFVKFKAQLAGLLVVMVSTMTNATLELLPACNICMQV